MYISHLAGSPPARYHNGYHPIPTIRPPSASPSLAAARATLAEWARQRLGTQTRATCTTTIPIAISATTSSPSTGEVVAGGGSSAHGAQKFRQAAGKPSVRSSGRRPLRPPRPRFRRRDVETRPAHGAPRHDRIRASLAAARLGALIRAMPGRRSRSMLGSRRTSSACSAAGTGCRRLGRGAWRGRSAGTEDRGRADRRRRGSAATPRTPERPAAVEPAALAGRDSSTTAAPGRTIRIGCRAPPSATDTARPARHAPHGPAIRPGW